MMKLLTVVLVILAIDCVSSTEVCKARFGKRVITFSNTGEFARFPCKYNAIKETICGSYKITITPGNMMEMERGKRYVIKTMWLAVEKLSDGKRWEGRTDLKIARKYLADVEPAPFRQKRGSLTTSGVFDFGLRTEDNEVSMTEKNNEFKITFGLYDPYGQWHMSSGFKFECFDSNFQPTNYPTQLCGNKTNNEVKEFKKSMGWRENRIATVFFNVFSNENIVQSRWDCTSAATAMQKACKNTEDRYRAAKLCWPILGRKRFRNCFTGFGDNPTDVFRDCVHFTCTDDINSCDALGTALDWCPWLYGVTDVVMAKCYPALFSL